MAEPERLKAYAKRMRREPTVAEAVLWSLVRDRRMAGLKFRRQVPIGRYIADFACFDPKIVLEADSARHMLSEDYDAVRDAWLSEQGFAVLRFTNGEIIDRSPRIEAAIRRAAGLDGWTGPSPRSPLNP